MVAAPRFADTGGVKPLPNAATPMPAFQARILPFPQATPAREPRFVWLLAAVAATAVLLRAWRIGAGLPDFLEEAFPLRLALGMKDAATGRVDWNPHFFNYPSLSIYLHFAVQQAVFAMGLVTGAWKSWADYLVLFQIDPTPMVLAARSVGVACDALTIVAAGMLAERLHRGAGFIAALLCALAPILIETSRSVFCDTLMAALALWALERTLAYLRDGNARTLHVAALLVGLAAGAKYPAAALGAALAVALVMREGRSGLRFPPRSGSRGSGCREGASGSSATCPGGARPSPGRRPGASFRRCGAGLRCPGSSEPPNRRRGGGGNNRRLRC